MHVFDAGTALEPLGPGRFRGRTHPAWANMVGPFGGTTAACLLRAPCEHPARLGEPVALTVNFAAALADGEFEVVANPVRTNRSTQHWTIELHQADGIVATASAVFATRRPTWGAPEAVAPEAVPAAASLPRAGTAGRPAWTQNLDMRFVTGGLPDVFDGALQPESASQVWLRDEPPRPLDALALASLCDAFFPRVMLRRRRLVPIGTVSMTTYFHADAAMLAAQGEQHVLGVVRPWVFRNGFFDQSAAMWSTGGELLATSHQIVYYRE